MSSLDKQLHMWPRRRLNPILAHATADFQDVIYSGISLKRCGFLRLAVRQEKAGAERVPDDPTTHSPLQQLPSAHDSIWSSLLAWNMDFIGLSAPG